MEVASNPFLKQQNEAHHENRYYTRFIVDKTFEKWLFSEVDDDDNDDDGGGEDGDPNNPGILLTIWWHG